MWAWQKFELANSAIVAIKDIFKNLNGNTMAILIIGCAAGWILKTIMTEKETQNGEA